jgi:hypothetical protein
MRTLKKYIFYDEQILDICKMEKYNFVLILMLKYFENTTPAPFLL